MKQIESLRKQLDKLDLQISNLLIARLKLSTKIIKRKVSLGLPVTDRKRERYVFNLVTKKRTQKEKKFLKEIYKTIFKVRRSLFVPF